MRSQQSRSPSPSEAAKARPAAPLFLCPAAAGWPSPAEDYIEKRLNLHTHLVRNESAAFFLYASGKSMQGAGIFDGDLLVVDRSIPPTPGRIVIAALEGELAVKRLQKRGKRLFLASENRGYPDFDITGREDACIWGVVTHAIHPL